MNPKLFDNECAVCGGTGTEYLMASDGDVHKDICTNCDGKGYFEVEDLREAM